MKRRLLIIFLLVTAIAAGCFWYGFKVEPKTLEVRKITINSPHWTGKPITIGFIADIHLGGPHIDPPRLDKIVALMNVEQPDIILLGGDYMDKYTPKSERSKTENDNINWGMAILGDLNAPYGVHAVLGNHDHKYSAQATQSNMESHGINFLDNRSAVIEDKLCLFGVADEYYGNPTDDGYHNCPANFPIIGLMHNPDSFSRIPTGTALMLAGHTHGGQINIPLIGRAVTATESGKTYAYGLKKAGATPVYITSGIGTSIMNARFRAPPEIVLITLQGQ